MERKNKHVTPRERRRRIMLAASFIRRGMAPLAVGVMLLMQPADVRTATAELTRRRSRGFREGRWIDRDIEGRIAEGGKTMVSIAREMDVDLDYVYEMEKNLMGKRRLHP